MHENDHAAAPARTMHPGGAPAGQLHTVLTQQGAELDELHNTLTTLEARLTPVMLERETPGNDRGEIPRELLAPIANTVQSHNDVIANATRRLRAVIEQLEV